MLKVVVTGYNSSQYLKKCLESINTQKYTNYECVVVNDCSSEHEFELYAKEYTNFLYIKNNENQGPLYSRIIGIKELNCKDDDIIFFIIPSFLIFTIYHLTIRINCYFTTFSIISEPLIVTSPTTSNVPLF